MALEEALTVLGGERGYHHHTGNFATTRAHLEDDHKAHNLALVAPVLLSQVHARLHTDAGDLLHEDRLYILECEHCDFSTCISGVDMGRWWEPGWEPVEEAVWREHALGCVGLLRELARRQFEQDSGFKMAIVTSFVPGMWR